MKNLIILIVCVSINKNLLDLKKITKAIQPVQQSLNLSKK